jgi:hypothetical protein
MAANQTWKIEIAFTSQPNALNPVYADVTPDVDGMFEIVAGETANSSDPGNTLTFQLQNKDQRYTPGNLLSATALKSGRKVRVTNTIADQLIELFTGYIQFPTIDQWVESNATEPRTQTITVTAVDQEARLSRGRAFVSALAEHIVYTGSTDLKGYWTLTEEQQPFAGTGPTAAALDLVMYRTGTTGLSVAPQPNTGLAPPGGENSGARMPSDPTGPGHVFIRTHLPAGFAPAVGASDAIVVVFWFAFAPTMAANDAAFQQILTFNAPTAAVTLERNVTTRQWTLTSTGLVGSISGGMVGNEALLPIGVYLKESTGVLELWTGGQRQTTTLTGAPVGAGTFLWGDLGYQIDYDLSHLQIYVGNNFGYTQFLEQIQQGYSPLEGQPTGSRIHTLLDYAGYPRGDAFRDIDPGVSVMSAATLAGLNPKDAIDVAVETEQGRFYISGRGQTVFADRKRLYNI